jgi:hypothetical protein
MQLPAEPSSGGRARAFLVARFAVYVVIIAIGGFYLLNRDTASGGQTERPGVWVSGRTTQQLPVEAKIDGDRVVLVDLSWRASCSDGRSLTWRDGFVDARSGDFERDGTAYSDEWEVTHPIWDGLTGRLNAHLQGTSGGAVTRGSVDFKLEVMDRGKVVETCESGPIGFAIDLQR